MVCQNGNTTCFAVKKVQLQLRVVSKETKIWQAKVTDFDRTLAETP